MSRENVEILERGIDAYNRLDLGTLAAMTTEDFEWFPLMVGAFESGSFQGREGIAAYFDDIRDAWEHLRVHVGEFRDLADDRVLMLGRVEGRGGLSGIEVDAPLGMLAEFRGDRLRRVSTYLGHEETLKAVGLAE
jgi:ketosteroid isomerase-like protein